jgi:hypothetical protein
MNDILSFAQQHLLLIGAWSLLLVAIILTEMINKRQKAPQVSPQQLVDKMNNQTIKVIDIRNSQNFRKSHILNSRNIPWLSQDTSAFKPLENEAVVLVCQQGQTASQLADKLKKQGFNNVQVLSGGLNTWQQNNLPLVKGK